jgi:sortase A
MKRIWERLISAEGKRWLRVASYCLIALGAVLLVIAGVSLGYRQWERRRLEVRLTQTASTARRTMPTLALRSTAGASAATSQAPTGTDQPLTATAMAPAAAEPVATPVTPAGPTAQLPVHIAFPDLGIDAPVVEMGWRIAEVDGERTSVWDLEAIKGGVGGHLINSALPGQPGNVVIAGHHNIEGEVFKDISLAWDDDSAEQQDDVTWRSAKLDGRTITVGDAAGEAFTYVVEGMYKLLDRDVSSAQRLENGRFMAPASEPMLTLVTCWPFDTNTHRIVVVAKLAGAKG